MRDRAAKGRRGDLEKHLNNKEWWGGEMGSWVRMGKKA